jgi:tRNA nucleotidyltransferase/poly(A) polymerase
MPHPTPQRDFALAVVHKLRAAGFEALWAGGCVRDELLGLVPKDNDVATSATPDQVRDLFGPRRTFAVGAAFGVITVLGPRAAGQIEVATFRADAEYSDGRRPDSVTFTTAEHDAQRRDFTINGLFFDPVANEVVDYVGGRADLERKSIRAIGDPRLRLSEDKLRMLRAVRFAATFGFEIEAETLRAIQDMVRDVNTVSAERIGMELRRMLVHPGRVHALDLLRETNLLDFVLPEVAAYVPAAWAETRSELGNLHNPTLPLALAALLRQTGDPAVTGAVGRRLRFATREHERAAWLLAHVADAERALELPWPQLQRLLVHDGGPELVALAEAIVGSDDPAIVFCHERLAWPEEKLNPRPLVDGSDLIGHGLAPSPDFARLLEAVRDAQLAGEIATSDEALALVQRLLTQGLDAHP